MDDFQGDQTSQTDPAMDQDDTQEEIVTDEVQILGEVEGEVYGVSREEGEESKEEVLEVQTPSQRDDYIKKVAEQEPPFVEKKIEEAKEEVIVTKTPVVSSQMESEMGESLAVDDEKFMSKIELDSEAQDVFEKATQSDNPEAVLDNEEFEEDKRLAEKLIKEAGFSPEMVQRALEEKKEMIKDQTVDASVKEISEITTDHAKEVLGQEYQEMEEENQ